MSENRQNSEYNQDVLPNHSLEWNTQALDNRVPLRKISPFMSSIILAPPVLYSQEYYLGEITISKIPEISMW